jgi:uncharacterized protein YbjT (DUF2867 family)
MNHRQMSIVRPDLRLQCGRRVQRDCPPPLTIEHERTTIMFTVMGATGQTGGATARALLDAGEEVRALGRSAGGLAELAAAGAETRAGDAGDPIFLANAFRGADAVYVLLPIAPEVPDWHAHQARLGEAIVTAVRDAGVPYVVAVSSVGV